MIPRRQQKKSKTTSVGGICQVCNTHKHKWSREKQRDVGRDRKRHRDRIRTFICPEFFLSRSVILGLSFSACLVPSPCPDTSISHHTDVGRDMIVMHAVDATAAATKLQLLKGEHKEQARMVAEYNGGCLFCAFQIDFSPLFLRHPRAYRCHFSYVCWWLVDQPTTCRQFEPGYLSSPSCPILSHLVLSFSSLSFLPCQVPTALSKL